MFGRDTIAPYAALHNPPQHSTTLHGTPLSLDYSLTTLPQPSTTVRNPPLSSTSFQVVACKKVDIMFTSVIASVDVTNSSGVQLQTSGNMPCAFVEKSHDVMVFLSKEAMETTSITTCASTGVNVTMPPKAEGEDPVEGALPEQYITKIVGGKLVTVPTEHKA